MTGLWLMAALLAWPASVRAGAMGGGGHERQHRPPPSPVRFAVISDPHLYCTRLGVSGSAFEDYF